VIQADGSSACQSFFFVVLELEPNGSWRLVDTVEIPAKYRSPSLSVESLVTRGESEIVVRDAETDTGTGILQRNLIVWKLLDGHLRVILDEPIQSRFAIPKGDGSDDNTDQDEQSTFTIQDKSPEVGFGMKQIFQRQTIRDHDRSIQRAWVWTWDPDTRTFRKVAYAFEPH
jgi:hypothetical protein